MRSGRAGSNRRVHGHGDPPSDSVHRLADRFHVARRRAQQTEAQGAAPALPAGREGQPIQQWRDAGIVRSGVPGHVPAERAEAIAHVDVAQVALQDGARRDSAARACVRCGWPSAPSACRRRPRKARSEAARPPRAPPSATIRPAAGVRRAVARFYAANVPDSRVGAVHHAAGDVPSGKEGDVLPGASTAFESSRAADSAHWSKRVKHQIVQRHVTGRRAVGSLLSDIKRAEARPIRWALQRLWWRYSRTVFVSLLLSGLAALAWFKYKV